MTADTSSVPLPASLEREPQQKRSRERMRRVLDASEALLIEQNLEEITTTMIAAKAGVSVGWLYRFFPDKNSVYETVLTVSLERLRDQLEEVPLDFSTSDWPSTVHAFLDHIFDFARNDSTFRRLWFSPMLNRAMVDINRAYDARLATSLAERIAPHLHASDPTLPYTVMRVFMGIVDKGVDLVFDDASPVDSALMMSQIHLAAETYLRAALEQGQPSRASITVTQ